MWVRKCDECGHVAVAPRPNPDKELSAAYTERKCRKCLSSGLDYGQEIGPFELIKGKIVRMSDENDLE